MGLRDQQALSKQSPKSPEVKRWPMSPTEPAAKPAAAVADQSAASSSSPAPRVGAHYTAIQGIYWANVAAQSVYAVVILQSRGFSNLLIGLIIAARAFTSVVMQPLIASFVDRIKQRVPIKYFSLGLICLAFVANLILYFSGSSLVWAIAAFALFGCSENVLAALNDALAIQYINGGHAINYSLARGTGSLIFAITCLPLAWLVRNYGNDTVLLSHAVLLITEFLIVLPFRNYPGPAAGAPERTRPTTGRQKSYWRIISRSVPLMVYLVASTCIYMANNAIYQYMINILTNVGGSKEDVGLAMFIQVACQFPMSLIYARIVRYFGVRRLLVFSYFMMTVRQVLLNIAWSPSVVLGFLFVELFAGGLMIPSEVFYINQVVDPDDVVKGQSLIRIIPSGLGLMLASLIGGRLLDLYGTPGLLRMSLGFASAGFIIMASYLLMQARKNRPARLKR